MKNGSQIAFVLGLIQVLMALFCECINISLLTYQHTTDHCIIHFVALEVIMDVSNFYAEAMMENKLKEFVAEADKPHRDMIEDPVTGEKRYKKGSEQKFGDRSCFHKLARIVYKLTRCFYVGVVFYFVPFSTLFMQFGFSLSADEKKALDAAK